NQGSSRWGRGRETHLPAEQADPQAAPWLPCANGYPGRSSGAGRAARQGPQAPVCLIPPVSLTARAAPQRRGPSLPITPISKANGLVRLKTRADFLRVAAARRRAVRPGLMRQAAARPPETPF